MRYVWAAARPPRGTLFLLMFVLLFALTVTPIAHQLAYHYATKIAKTQALCYSKNNI